MRKATYLNLCKSDVASCCRFMEYAAQYIMDRDPGLVAENKARLMKNLAAKFRSKLPQ